MKPVYTTEWGQCFSAAVASVLEISLEDCPLVPTRIDEFFKTAPPAPVHSIEEALAHPERIRESEWYRAFCKWIEETRPEFTARMQEAWDAWLAERGLVIHSFAAPSYTVPGYSVAGCEYGQHSHTLVLLDGRPVFDPDPNFTIDRPEFPWTIKTVHIIAPTNPAVLVKA
jgi:hypothetical protein